MPQTVEAPVDAENVTAAPGGMVDEPGVINTFPEVIKEFGKIALSINPKVCGTLPTQVRKCSGVVGVPQVLDGFPYSGKSSVNVLLKDVRVLFEINEELERLLSRSWVSAVKASSVPSSHG